MKKVKLVFKQDAAGAWRWQIQHGNGKVLDASSEGFASIGNARRNLLATRDALLLLTEEHIHRALLVPNSGPARRSA